MTTWHHHCWVVASVSPSWKLTPTPEKYLWVIRIWTALTWARILVKMKLPSTSRTLAHISYQTISPVLFLILLHFCANAKTRDCRGPRKYVFSDPMFWFPYWFSVLSSFGDRMHLKSSRECCPGPGLVTRDHPETTITTIATNKWSE